jgi:methionyl-tRNA formyltransferase
MPTPVGERAIALGLPLEAPPTVRDPEFLERLRSLRPEVIIVADYGEILREEFISLASTGAFNLHGSLLPRHRGASPVAAALLAGDSETGVSLFRITRGLDEGPVVDRAATPIKPLETAGELEDRLAGIAAELLSRNLDRLFSGTFSEEPQRNDLATMAPKLPRGIGAIDWQLPPAALENFIRALSPRPGAFSFLLQSTRSPCRIRILLAREFQGESGGKADSPGTLSPGTVSSVDREGFRVACGGGEIEILRIQRAGKPAMKTADFLRGCVISPGDRFTSSS